MGSIYACVLTRRALDLLQVHAELRAVRDMYDARVEALKRDVRARDEQLEFLQVRDEQLGFLQVCILCVCWALTAVYIMHTCRHI